MAIITLLFISGIGYGLFFWGRMAERRAYTGAFIKQVEAAYWQGYNDRNTECVTDNTRIYQSGLVDGRKRGYEQCVNEDYKVKDNY